MQQRTEEATTQTGTSQIKRVRSLCSNIDIDQCKASYNTASRRSSQMEREASERASDVRCGAVLLSMYMVLKSAIAYWSSSTACSEHCSNVRLERPTVPTAWYAVAIMSERRGDGCTRERERENE